MIHVHAYLCTTVVNHIGTFVRSADMEEEGADEDIPIELSVRHD